MHTLILRTLSFAVALTLLAGCGGAPQFMIEGGSDLNAGGNAVTVGLYQLNSKTAFEGRDFGQFWQDPVNALGGELISSQTVTLYPNEPETLEIELEDGARYVGIAANFREPDPERWKTIYPVDELSKRFGSKEVTITVGSSGLSAVIE
ncbi:MAG: type VI secretion system lipoprotein TssJ [Bacteroidetes bacterium]|jgi:type VI secretion system protein VasD|nr:type VI secretion system lipoprotein TssJ [Bacteroidota bacterium]